MTRFARDPLYRRHRFPTEIIAHAVWLYFRFPLSLRMVEAILAARGIIVLHQTVRLWAEKFGGAFAYDIRRRTGRPARRANCAPRQWTNGPRSPEHDLLLKLGISACFVTVKFTMPIRSQDFSEA